MVSDMAETKLPVTWMWRGQKQHLVSESMDGDTKLVTYKHWLKYKQKWVYVTEERWLVDYTLELINRKE